MFAAPAYGQTACGNHDDIVKRLKGGYKESRQSVAIDATGKLVETFVSQSGSWTIVVTTPGGRACVVAVGEDWRQVNEPMGTML